MHAVPSRLYSSVNNARHVVALWETQPGTLARFFIFLLAVQIVPSRGFKVRPNGSYTLRIAIADVNSGLVDSVLLLPTASLRLIPAPIAMSGGPYAVVSWLGQA
jgi:hypothetical protein